MFIIDGEQPYGTIIKKSKNPFSKSISPPSNQLQTKAVNIQALIDDDYFKTVQTTSEQTKYRRLHQRDFEPEMKDKFCSFEFTFELNSLTIQLYGGKDFDFDPSPATVLKILEGISPSSLDNKESHKSVQGRPFIVEENFFETTSRQD